MSNADIVRQKLLSLLTLDDPLQVDEEIKELASRYGHGVRLIRQQFNNLKNEINSRVALVNESGLIAREISYRGQTFLIPSKYAVKEGVLQAASQGFDGVVHWMPIANAIIIVIKRIVNIDTNEHSVELLIRKSGRDKLITCGQEVISSSSLIISKLSPLGVPVNSINAMKVIAFLDDFIHENFERLEYAFTSTGNGWVHYGRLSLFIFGEMVIAPKSQEHKFQIDSSKGKNERPRFSTKGVRDEWGKAVTSSLTYDIPLFLISASLAAPLLSIFKASSFTVNIEGNSTTGKTTATDLALSFWGDPNLMKSTWDTTLAGMETHLLDMNCLATNLDDASQARSPDHIKKILYMIANQKGATRSDENLKKRATANFSVVLMSSSESSLLSNASLQGEAARLIEFNRLPWNEKSPEAAALTSSISEALKQNNGFYAMDYLQYLVETVNDEDRLALLRDRYKKILSRLGPKSANPYTKRLMPALGCCYLALEVLHELIPELGLTPQRIDALFDFVITDRDRMLDDFKDLPLRAYQYVWQRIQMSPRKFDRSEREIWGAYITRGNETGYAIFQESLRLILEEGNFSYNSCSKYFKDNEYVWLSKNGGLHIANINDHSTRVFVFSESIAKKLGVLERLNDDGLQDYKITSRDQLI